MTRLAGRSIARLIGLVGVGCAVGAVAASPASAALPLVEKACAGPTIGIGGVAAVSDPHHPEIVEVGICVKPGTTISNYDFFSVATGSGRLEPLAVVPADALASAVGSGDLKWGYTPSDGQQVPVGNVGAVGMRVRRVGGAAGRIPLVADFSIFGSSSGVLSTQATTTIGAGQPRKDFTLVIGSDRLSGKPGQSIRFSATLTNRSDATVDAVRLVGHIPPSLSLLTTARVGGSYCTTGSQFTCELGTLPPGRKVVVTWRAQSINGNRKAIVGTTRVVASWTSGSAPSSAAHAARAARGEVTATRRTTALPLSRGKRPTVVCPKDKTKRLDGYMKAGEDEVAHVWATFAACKLNGSWGFSWWVNGRHYGKDGQPHFRLAGDTQDDVGSDMTAYWASGPGKGYREVEAIFKYKHEVSFGSDRCATLRLIWSRSCQGRVLGVPVVVAGGAGVVVDDATRRARRGVRLIYGGFGYPMTVVRRRPAV